MSILFLTPLFPLKVDQNNKFSKAMITKGCIMLEVVNLAILDMEKPNYDRVLFNLSFVNFVFI